MVSLLKQVTAYYELVEYKGATLNVEALLTNSLHSLEN